MKRIWFIIGCIFLGSGQVFAQTDTLVVEDYTKIMVHVGSDGNLSPVTDFSDHRQVGFFIKNAPEGSLRICNNGKITCWVNGRLVLTIDSDCEIVDPSIFFQYVKEDTVFVALSATEFDDLICERVIFEEIQVVKEGPQPRSVRNIFREFNIILISFTLFCFALFAISFPARLNFLLGRTYSLKTSTYEFIGTGFWNRANFSALLLVSSCIAFEIIYISHFASNYLIPESATLGGYLLTWLIIIVWIVMVLLVKRFLIFLVSRLFKMRKLRDWQLFDLINFFGFFSVLLFIIILWDFLIKAPSGSWINPYFFYYFLAVLILFEVWFTIKFVTNSSYQKLLIISYLCATEIIPSVFFIGWIFK